MSPEPVIEKVQAASGSYDLVIGIDLMVGVGKRLKKLFSRKNQEVVRRLFVIADDRQILTEPLHMLKTSLADSGFDAHVFRIAASEATKSFPHLMTVVQFLLENRVERSEPVIAFGGGVIGDLAGFAAAITLRGLPFIQIPTTLLAQVDSSVGGKTGINFGMGKNLVGAFHAPRLVLSDGSLLRSLPPREFYAGIAEVIKIAVMRDAGFFKNLEKLAPNIKARDVTIVPGLVAHACRLKAAVVSEDEHEAGVRALLNFGHTFGHALEEFYEYDGRLLHGEAVALGMVAAANLSVRCSGLESDQARRIIDLISACGLPTSLADLSLGKRLGPGTGEVGAEPVVGAPMVDRLRANMASDKKVEAGTIRFALVDGNIGRGLLSAVDEEALLVAIRTITVADLVPANLVP